jgi:hypothetical protein
MGWPHSPTHFARFWKGFTFSPFQESHLLLWTKAATKVEAAPRFPGVSDFGVRNYDLRFKATSRMPVLPQHVVARNGLHRICLSMSSHEAPVKWTKLPIPSQRLSLQIPWGSLLLMLLVRGIPPYLHQRAWPLGVSIWIHGYDAPMQMVFNHHNLWIDITFLLEVPTDSSCEPAPYPVALGLPSSVRILRLDKSLRMSISNWAPDQERGIYIWSSTRLGHLYCPQQCRKNLKGNHGFLQQPFLVLCMYNIIYIICNMNVLLP